MTESSLAIEQQLKSLWSLGGLTWRELLRRVWHGIDRNDLINRAYELAYNFLLAVFPMLLFLLGLLGMFASEGGSLRNGLFYYFQLALPPTASKLLIQTVQQVTPVTTGGKLTFGVLFALYSGSAGMTQLISTLNSAYEVRETRSWIKVHLVSLGLTLSITALLLIALFGVLAGGHAVLSFGAMVGLTRPAIILAKLLQWIFALAFVIFAFAVIYYYAPNVETQHWYWLTPGSTIGLIFWVLASAALRFYLHYFNTYNKTYGSLGAVIVLLLWFYVAGLSFLIGSQINATIEHAAAEHGHPEAKPAAPRSPEETKAA